MHHIRLLGGDPFIAEASARKIALIDAVRQDYKMDAGSFSCSPVSVRGVPQQGFRHGRVCSYGSAGPHLCPVEACLNPTPS